MACEICGRSSCTKSFHSIEAQEEFDNIADKIKDRAKDYISHRVNRLNGIYDDNDKFWVSLEDVLSIIDGYN